MIVNLKMTYILEVTPQEFRVISAALRGNLKEEWRAEALELQDKLFQARKQAAESQLANISKLGDASGA